jgi:hypothetical protein
VSNFETKLKILIFELDKKQKITLIITLRESLLISLFSSKNLPDITDLGDGTKKDQFYFELEGLAEIDFGTKSMDTCIESVQVGVLKDSIDWERDYTGCVASQYYIV